MKGSLKWNGAATARRQQLIKQGTAGLPRCEMSASRRCSMGLVFQAAFGESLRQPENGVSTFRLPFV